VAIPSSAMSAVRPASGSGGAPAAEQPRPALHLGALPALGRAQGPLVDPCGAHDVGIAHGRALLAHGAHRQLGLPRHPDLAHDEHVEGRAERPRHLGRHADAAARQTEDDRIGGRIRDQQRREPPPRVGAIREPVHASGLRRYGGAVKDPAGR
jgi:hypothetical protein